VEVDSGRVRAGLCRRLKPSLRDLPFELRSSAHLAPRLFFRTGRGARPVHSLLPRPVRTRGALAAWLGNQKLLPCRAWVTPGTKERIGGEAARPLSTSTSSLISLSPPPPLLSTSLR